MKKSIKIYDQLTNTDIHVCYGNEEYLRIAKKLKYKDPHPLHSGLTVELLSGYIIAIKDNFKKPLFCKSTLVHEMSHCTNFIMECHQIKDDEFRSLFMGLLYEKITPWIDKIIEKESK